MRSITIECPNHDTQFDVFVFYNDDDGEGWKPPIAGGEHPPKGFISVVEFLVGDKFVGNADSMHPSILGRNDFRMRYRFKCPECGGKSVTVTAEKLNPLLDRLSDTGTDNISIQGLASIVL